MPDVADPLQAERLIAFTQRLVRCPSLPGEEERIVALAVTEMRAFGYDQVWIDSNGSAIGIVNGAAPGPTLLLDAHCDTVGIAPGISWTHDPFGGEVVEDPSQGDRGAIFGRGAADMKGALAAMICAAAGVNRMHLAGRVVVSVSVLEERIEGAALQAVMEQIWPDFVIIGEATDLNLARGGRGRAEICLETIGRPAHSSSPHLARNAVLDMLNVITVMERLALPRDPFLGPAVQALTDIISDPYPGYSVIPSRCRVTYDRRLLPEETADGVLQQITSHPDLAGIEVHASVAHGSHRTYTGAMLAGPKFFPAWLLPEDHHFVRAALSGLVAAGLDPMLRAYQFCTNAAYSAGLAEVPTVGFGPGREVDAHIIDERLEIAALIAAERGYRGIIEAVLEVEDPLQRGKDPRGGRDVRLQGSAPE